ncbi:MAG: lamin tail domain-containing protein [Alphaproteobacteria bacterium]|nr:lamin tail domain-containing protein [Alphaproteobacteria bacterium]
MPRRLLILVPLLTLAACGSDNVIAYPVGGRDDGGSDDGGSDEGGGPGGADSGADDDGASGGGGGGAGGGGGGGQSAQEPGPGDIVISEIMIDPTAVGDAQGEWVELYNPTDTAWKLRGLYLGDEGVDALPLDVAAVIQPGAYAVLCASAADNGGVSCDGTYHYNTYGDGFSLSNSGDEVILETEAGTVIDAMSYGETQVTPGVALGVRPAALDASDNDASGMWCPQSSALPDGDLGTPGARNDGC